jgi:hypothetical protein
METAGRPVLFRPQPADTSIAAPPTQASARTLVVTATYALSEAGRKASLLAGSNGRAMQQLEIQVPANRLHLVTVNGKGLARLKLRPRYELNGEERVVCIDAPPTYDSPPTAEDLLRDASRNHQLERAFHAERTAARAKRTEVERARRTEVAAAFLSDQAQRALIHPAPSPKRCYLATPYGHMRFDVDTDDGPAREVPREALRRFRHDVNAAKERREKEHAEQERLHEERKQAVTAWIAEHGTEDHKARQKAGLLSAKEVVEAMADEVFRPLAARRRYLHDGATLMQAHVRHWTGQAPEPVGTKDFVVSGHPARSATRREWEILQEIQAAIPHATVNLHIRELIWRRDPGVPRLTRVTIVVTQRIGPVMLRREYLIPDGDRDSTQEAHGTTVMAYV